VHAAALTLHHLLRKVRISKRSQPVHLFRLAEPPPVATNPTGDDIANAVHTRAGIARSAPPPQQPARRSHRHRPRQMHKAGDKARQEIAVPPGRIRKTPVRSHDGGALDTGLAPHRLLHPFRQPAIAMATGHARERSMIIDTHLNDGTPICIREVRKDDEQRLKDGIAQLSPQSRYMRFFSGMREAPQKVIDTLVTVDGHDHIAWGAIRNDLPGQPALGVVHAFRDNDDPETAEFSIAVIDAYHGRGLGRLLTAVLLLDCQHEGLEHLTVHILPENRPALSLARSLGAHHLDQAEGVMRFDIVIDDALAVMQLDEGVPGLARVFAQYALNS
jgi:ribosomal protein S18 acetylase RimI-like enzyme